jgi:hypothetical protein
MGSVIVERLLAPIGEERLKIATCGLFSQSILQATTVSL